MKDYAIWDEDHKKWIDLSKNQIVLNLCNGGLKGLFGGDGYMSSWKLFEGIGLKDINDKPIYADSSIFEFDYFGDILTGYFTYDKKYLSFLIRILTIGECAVMSFADKVWNNSIKNFKIIDTIQENSMGLIKDNI